MDVTNIKDYHKILFLLRRIRVWQGIYGKLGSRTIWNQENFLHLKTFFIIMLLALVQFSILHNCYVVFNTVICFSIPETHRLWFPWHHDIKSYFFIHYLYFCDFCFSPLPQRSHKEVHFPTWTSTACPSTND